VYHVPCSKNNLPIASSQAYDLFRSKILQIPPQEISHPLKPVYWEFVESRLLLSVFGLIAWGLRWIVEIPVVRVAAS
jgi:hypothetical protein